MKRQLLHSSIFILMAWSFAFSAGFVSRLVVPLYFTVDLSTGYDSNVLRLSDSELDNVDSEMDIIGNAKTIDSAVIKGRFSLEYRPAIFQNIGSRFRFRVSNTQFSGNSQKAYQSYFLSGALKFRSYEWFKVKYSLIPAYYLREFYDSDEASGDRLSCNFSSEKLGLSYSLPVFERTFLRLKISQNNQYYSENFTEYDTELRKVTLQMKSEKVKNWHLNLSAFSAEGDNISYGENYPGATDNRSYLASGAYFGLWREFSKLDVGFSTSLELRRYSSEDENDPLHFSRQHEDWKQQIFLRYTLGKSKLTLYLRHRQKYSYSDFSWVEELKSFKKFEIQLKFSKKFTWNIYH